MVRLPSWLRRYRKSTSFGLKLHACTEQPSTLSPPVNFSVDSSASPPSSKVRTYVPKSSGPFALSDLSNLTTFARSSLERPSSSNVVVVSPVNLFLTRFLRVLRLHVYKKRSKLM